MTPYPGKICTGFRPSGEQGGEWGAVGTIRTRYNSGTCPDGYAYVGVRLPGSPDVPAASVPISGDCCPLPDDALLDEHQYAADACPEGFVATGAATRPWLEQKNCVADQRSPGCGGDAINIDYLMLCTKVNTKRYTLSRSQPGIYWGWTRHTYESFADRITRLSIPVALRDGIGRLGREQWAIAGCTGAPAGSILVKKAGRRCSEFYYSELLYRGMKGDPPPGTPVKIFPDCSSLSGSLDPNPSCLGGS